MIRKGWGLHFLREHRSEVLAAWHHHDVDPQKRGRTFNRLMVAIV
jgi:hypothetical protein